MMDFSQVFADPDFVATYQVRRAAVGTFVNGLYQPSAATTLDVVAIIWPKPGASLVLDLDGTRRVSVIEGVSQAELRTRSSGVEPDVIVYKGRDYSVITAGAYDQGGFWSFLAEATKEQ